MSIEQIEVGQIVAKDFRTASIFTKYGIDFCCKGGVRLSDACAKKNLPLEIIREEVLSILDQYQVDEEFNSMNATELIQYILVNHHAYVESRIPDLLFYLNKINRVHGERHPELEEINTLFGASASELTQHMKKEELVLFPWIEGLEKRLNGATVKSELKHGIQNPIYAMEFEHSNEGDRFERIQLLSNNFTPPSDACTTYKVAFQMLREFQTDLHKHIHLENNLLFPKALQMEKTLFE